MKNAIKWFGFALVAAICFSITACDDGSGSNDIIPNELQGTWVGYAGTVIINGSSFTIQETGGSPRNVPIKSVQKGSTVLASDGEYYTVYTLIPSNGGNNAVIGLSQDRQTIVDYDGYYFFRQ
jgi:hypothetical protein